MNCEPCLDTETRIRTALTRCCACGDYICKKHTLEEHRLVKSGQPKLCVKCASLGTLVGFTETPNGREFKLQFASGKITDIAYISD